jgi:chromate transporter
LTQAAAATEPVELREATLWEIAVVFGVIAMTAFGGGQKAQIRQQLVQKKHWITDRDFIEGLEVAQLLPGPNVLNLAVFMGQRVRGTPGAIVAFLAGSVPPFLIVLAAGAFYFSKYNIPIVHAALFGAAAAAVGLTLGNAIELTQDLWPKWLNLFFMVATALAVSYFHLPLVLTLLVFGGMSMYAYYREHSKASEKA